MGRLDQQRRNLTAENTAPRSQVSSPPGITPGKGPARKADTQVIAAWNEAERSCSQVGLLLLLPFFMLQFGKLKGYYQFKNCMLNDKLGILLELWESRYTEMHHKIPGEKCLYYVEISSVHTNSNRCAPGCVESQDLGERPETPALSAAWTRPALLWNPGRGGQTSRGPHGIPGRERQTLLFSSPSPRLIFGNWETFGLEEGGEDNVQEWFLLTSGLQI